jgi:hypothetical protein
LVFGERNNLRRIPELFHSSGNCFRYRIERGDVMARMSSSCFQTSSSGYGPSYSSGGSGEFPKIAAAILLGIVGLLIGLALAGLLWTIGWTYHWALDWNFGRAVMASRGWWIGLPGGTALIGVVLGLIFGD